MPSRIEFWELIDPIEYVGYQLFKEHTRRNANFAAKRSCDGSRQIIQIGVIGYLPDSLGVCAMSGVDVTEFHADLFEFL
jgi:hypothetical protein